jgi:hypothetical protein
LHFFSNDERLEFIFGKDIDFQINDNDKIFKLYLKIGGLNKVDSFEIRQIDSLSMRIFC